MTPTCYSDLQLSNAWTEQGDSDGQHGSCHLTCGQGLAPMLAQFDPAQRPPGQNWDNVYILHRNAASNATTWVYHASVRFPTMKDVANCTAFEKDWQKNDGSSIFNCGWQFLFGVGLRVWNRSVGAWSDKAHPILPMPATLPQCLPTRITALFAHDAHNVTYLGMAFNGVWTPLNITYPAVAKAQSPYVNNAWQLDSKGQGAPINCELHECSVVGF